MTSPARIDGVKLLAFFKRLDVPQTVVARHLGIAKSAVCAWARGREAMPGKYRKPMLALARKAVQQAKARPPAVEASEPPYPTERHPVVSYLLRLNTEVSRDSMRDRLNIAARLLTDGRCDALTCPWHTLDYTHLLALWATMAKPYAPPNYQRHPVRYSRCHQGGVAAGLFDGRTTRAPMRCAYRAGRAIAERADAGSLGIGRIVPVLSG